MKIKPGHVFTKKKLKLIGMIPSNDLKRFINIRGPAIEELLEAVDRLMDIKDAQRPRVRHSFELDFIDGKAI